MKSYLSLVPISAKVHKRQSRMTRICIILAVFLVTSIFSMVEMWTKAETTAMRHNHGDWHIALQNIQDNEAEQIRKDNDVAFSSWYDSINANAEQDYYIGGKNAVIYGIEEAYSTNIMNYPTEGNYPQNEKEVVLSADAKELFGVKVGDSITLNTHAGDLGYTITGFYQDDSEFNSMVNGICVYVNRDTFNHIRSLNGETSASQFYIRFQNENRLKKTIADFKLKYNLTDENVKENMAVLSMLGASSNDSINQLYPLAAICFVIILISGVFMISSCMNSTVAQRTKFFGMMRCIGASKKQIIHFVRLEALNWCKTAIPIGCILGTITCWILCAILRFLVKGEWADMPLFSVSVTGILCGAVVGIVTVFIAAHSPAKQAAKVSPVAAVSGNTGTSKHGGCAAKSGVFKIETSLGIHHATEAKKNLFLITGSFALTIALFLSFAACLDLVHKLLPSVSDFTPDIVISSEDETNSVDRNLAEDISEIPGVKSVFGTKLHVAYPVEINGNAGTVDLFSYDESMLDSFKKSVMSGDLSKVYGNSGYALAIYNQDNRLNVGDKIKIGDTEIEIACIASEGVGSVSGAATMVCSEETYTQLTGEQDYALVSVVLEKNISETEVSKIRNLSSDYVFADNRAENSDVNGSYWVFRLAAYGFLAIISFITILNIMNSISMSVSARIKQYGAMRAVGMGNRQITKMITAEAITYAACGTIIGFVLGLAAGFGIPIAQAFGAREEKRMLQTIMNAFYLCIFFSIVLTVLTHFTTETLLQWMQTPANIFKQSYDYISIIFYGLTCTIAYNFLASVSRALGDSKTPLIFLIISSVLNVVLDLSMIINFHMGVRGAALATVIAQGISAVLCFIYMAKKYPNLRFDHHARSISFPIIKKLINIAVPMALQYSITAVGAVILQSAVNTLGSAKVAAIAAAQKLSMFFTQPMDMMGSTMATFSGQNLGAGKIERIFKGIKESMLLVIGYGIVACIFMIFFGKYLSLLFVAGNETSVINDAQQFLICNSIFYFVLGILFVSRNTIQGLGKSALTMLAGGAELVARAFVAFALVGKFGYNAICFANPIAWFAAIIILIPTLVILMNKLKKEHS